MKICFASNNQHKIQELNQMLSGKHEIVGLGDLGMGITEDIEETGETFEENSLIKSRYVFERFNMPVFADDSGLIVHSLKGEPGVYSARYAGPEKDDEKNMNLLLNRLSALKDRNAEFKTVISFIDVDGQEQLFSGSIAGVILKEKFGENGFGYDPIFQPNGYDLTFAQLSSEEKNKISHRAKAVEKLVKHLYNYQ
ncbi:MAG: RdgB/HAM1 family non-canonical purine NTP pyrophosphatase [Bacteroidota bacterium]